MDIVLALKEIEKYLRETWWNDFYDLMGDINTENPITDYDKQVGDGMKHKLSDYAPDAVDGVMKLLTASSDVVTRYQDLTKALEDVIEVLS